MRLREHAIWGPANALLIDAALNGGSISSLVLDERKIEALLEHELDRSTNSDTKGPNK
jgi:hypothetical protein